MSGYGLVCDDGWDSKVEWFDNMREALAEYLSYGRPVSEIQTECLQGTFYIVKIITKKELEKGATS